MSFWEFPANGWQPNASICGATSVCGVLCTCDKLFKNGFAPNRSVHMSSLARVLLVS